MKKILYIVLFVCSFANSQMIMDSYKFSVAGSSCDALNIWPDDDPATPSDECEGATVNETYWINWTSRAIGTVESTGSNDGTYHIKIVNDGVNSRLTVAIPVTASTAYTIVADLKEDSGDASYILIRDADIVGGNIFVQPTASWAQYTQGFTTEVGVTTLYLDMYAQNTGDVFYIDNFHLTAD